MYTSLFLYMYIYIYVYIRMFNYHYYRYSIPEDNASTTRDTPRCDLYPTGATLIRSMTTRPTN